MASVKRLQKGLGDGWRRAVQNSWLTRISERTPMKRVSGWLSYRHRAVDNSRPGEPPGAKRVTPLSLIEPILDPIQETPYERRVSQIPIYLKSPQRRLLIRPGRTVKRLS